MSRDSPREHGTRGEGDAPVTPVSEPEVEDPNRPGERPWATPRSVAVHAVLDLGEQPVPRGLWSRDRPVVFVSIAAPPRLREWWQQPSQPCPAPARTPEQSPPAPAARPRAATVWIPMTWATSVLGRRASEAGRTSSALRRPGSTELENPATMGCRPSVDRNTIHLTSDIATVVLKNNSTPGKGKG